MGMMILSSECRERAVSVKDICLLAIDGPGCETQPIGNTEGELCWTTGMRTASKVQKYSPCDGLYKL